MTNGRLKRDVPLVRRGWPRSAIAGLLAVLGVGLFLAVWIWWLAARNPNVRFLSRIGPAEWIVYPLVPRAKARNAIEMAGVFQRQWWLERVPTSATLQVRAFGRCQITLNNTPLGVALRAGENWKKPTVYDVSSLLHAGQNEISVVVANSTGPPALWLSLKTGEWTLNSDETWHVSLAGAVWQSAHLASAPMVIRKGNPLAGGERCVESLVKRLPTLLLFAGLSLGILCVGRHLWRRRNTQGTLKETGLSKRQAIVLFMLAASLWIILFAHNLKLLPAVTGFDAAGHLEYIDYIRQRHALPLANEGWEMLQAPLYYLLCASILSVHHLSATSAAGAAVLRFLGLVLGLIQIGLVFASLRLIFPNDARKQIVGLVLAAFMPVHLYLYHYVTNEILAATLATASIYCCLRIFNSERAAGIGLYAALGLCLGAALLSKITVLAVATVVLATLAGRLLIQREHNVRVWLRTMGLACFLCAVVSGWHYFRVWIHFGTILIAAYGGPTGLVWWADPGYGTAAYYARFGQSLVAPLFSGFNGFADGIYSTLWGDGLCGGSPSPIDRPPWNYDLIAAGYWLAVLPTVAILVGTAAAAISMIRRPKGVWFLLAGVVVLMGVGLICFVLRHPYYFANTKAHYGLPAMMSLCAFGAWGMDILTRRCRTARVVLWIGLGTWAMNSYASVWIQARAPYTRIVLSQELAGRGNYSAAIEMLRDVLRTHPQNASARLALAETLGKMGNTAEALQQYQTAWHDHPNDPDCATTMAFALAQQGQFSNAIELVQQVIQLEPDRPDVFPLLGRLLAEQGRFDRAIAAYEEALRFTPDNPYLHDDLGTLHLGLGQYEPAAEHFLYVLRINPDDADAHGNLGVALMKLGQPQEAIAHFSEVVRLRPEDALALANLAWIRATHINPAIRDGAAAVELAERARRLTDQQRPELLDTLAAAYAEAGRFREAVQTAQKAVAIALATGQQEQAKAIQTRLESYKAGQPFHE